MGLSALVRARRAGRTSARPARVSRVPREPLLAALGALVFIAVTVWWLTADRRVPDFDSGMHMTDAFIVHAEWAQGQLLAPFTDFNNYPPLVHIVGAIGVFLGGQRTAPLILAQDLVFVPLLVAGCYGVGNIAYGRLGGLLAAVFALGTPMIVSEMREFYLDPGEAAMVAVSAWGILASRRFERVGVSALAGLACGIGMLSKQTFVLFVGGLVLVVLIRGGWRRWRGLFAFLLAGGAFALPWYVDHLDQLRGLTAGATAGGTAGAGGNVGENITPPLYSARNVGWYLWNMLNHQLLAPLTVLFLLGAVLGIWRFVRRRDPSDLTPELIGGGLVGYLGMTYVTLKDPRYTLPALVYVAALGVGWIALARPFARRWLVGLVTAIAALNFVMVSFGVGPTLRITLPGAPPAGDSLAGARTATVISSAGWLRGGPVKDGDLLGLLRGLRRVGVKGVEFDGGSTNSPDFNQSGLTVFAIIAGMPIPPIGNLTQIGPQDAFILRRTHVPGDPPACQVLTDGTGVYVELGNPLRGPFETMTFVCPGRKPLYYKRTAPLPESISHVIGGAPGRELLAVMRAMRRQGIRTVEFDAASANTDFFETIGLQRLASIAGLSVPPVYAPATLGPRQAFMLRHFPATGDPPPCERFPDGSGLYIVLGNPVIPFADYRFYCPVRTPRFYTRAAG